MEKDIAKKVDQTEMKWNEIEREREKWLKKKTIEKDRMNKYDHHETCKEVMKMKGNKAEDRWSQDSASCFSCSKCCVFANPTREPL